MAGLWLWVKEEISPAQVSAMNTEIILDVSMLLIFVIATAVFLKWGGKEYEYDRNGDLVEVKDDEARGDAKDDEEPAGAAPAAGSPVPAGVLGAPTQPIAA